jgi:hypothetical protein
MDYSPFVKKLSLPTGAAAPTQLTYDDLVATAIARSHLDDDVRGINASIALIQQTRPHYSNVEIQRPEPEDESDRWIFR